MLYRFTTIASGFLASVLLEHVHDVTQHVPLLAFPYETFYVIHVVPNQIEKYSH